MTEQPKNFGFGEDETMLKDSAAKFFADNCSARQITWTGSRRPKHSQKHRVHLGQTSCGNKSPN